MKNKPPLNFKKKLLSEEDLKVANESVCIHRTLINACRDCFVWEQRHQRDRATGRKLAGGGRLPWSTGIRKFPALITEAKWKREQLKKIQNQKQVEKAGNGIFLARRNIFHFRSPTTHFQCKILFKKRNSPDKTAEGHFPSSHNWHSPELYQNLLN